MRLSRAQSLLFLCAIVALPACSAAEPTKTEERRAPGTVLRPEPPASRTMYRRGDVGPGGGFVFYVSRTPFPCGEDLERLCNHLEVAPYASEVARSWTEYTEETETGQRAEGTRIGTGQSNTRIIVSRGGGAPDTSAAAYADAYEHNGYDDWYLPSLDECHELTIARELIGGFTFGVYWTSTERDGATAWYQHFMNSFQFPEAKATSHQVRPVRAF